MNLITALGRWGRGGVLCLYRSRALCESHMRFLFSLFSRKTRECECPLSRRNAAKHCLQTGSCLKPDLKDFKWQSCHSSNVTFLSSGSLDGKNRHGDGVYFRFEAKRRLARSGALIPLTGTENKCFDSAASSLRTFGAETFDCGRCVSAFGEINGEYSPHDLFTKRWRWSKSLMLLMG